MNMTIITTIHQPNQDLFLMFDNIYVLAKGGVCVYSGLPQNLKQHLIECHIDCNENQIPIEVLLKVSSKDRSDESLNGLKDKKNSENNNLYEKCLNQKMISYSEQTNTSKRFSFKDCTQILLQTMTSTRKSHWKVYLIFFSFMIFSGVMMRSHQNSEMIKPDGCVEYSFRHRM